MNNPERQNNDEETRLDLEGSDAASETQRQIGRIASEVTRPGSAQAPLSPEQQGEIERIAKEVVNERPFTDY